GAARYGCGPARYRKTSPARPSPPPRPARRPGLCPGPAAWDDRTVRGRHLGATRRGGFQMNAQSSNPEVAATTARTPDPLYGGSGGRRITVRDLAAGKARGEKWPMLTSYDALTARVFDE